METEINVVEDVTPIVSIENLLFESQQVIFERLAQENPQILRGHFESFLEASVKLTHRNSFYVRPTILELMFRKIVELGQVLSKWQRTPVVVPIIQSRKKTGDVSGGAYDAKFRKRKLIQSVPQQPQQHSDIPAIRVRFDVPVYCATTDKRIYIAPTNEEIMSVGIKINRICINSRDTNYQQAQQIQFTLKDRLLLGNYTHEDLAQECDIMLKPKYTTIKESIVMFDQIANDKMWDSFNDIYDYLMAAYEYAYSASTAYWMFSQIEYAMRTKYESRLTEILIIPQYTREVSLSLPPPKYLEPELFARVEAATAITLSYDTEKSIIFDLSSAGLLDVLYFAQIYGPDSAIVSTLIKNVSMRNARIAFQKRVQAKLIEDINQIAIWMSIIEQKLNIKRAHEIMAIYKSKPWMSIKQIMTLLKPTEQKQVQLEYDRKNIYLAAIVGNKCAHVSIYKRVRSLVALDTLKKYYDQLKPFMILKNLIATEYIICNVCGLPLICPHVKEYIELNLAQAKFNEIKSVMTKYMADIALHDNYYCKVCGEKIADIDIYSSVEQSPDIQSVVSDELRVLMWSEMSSAINHINFGTLINITNLIKDMLNVIYRPIVDIEKQLLKSKTNTVDDMNNTMRLFISIYSYAYIITLISQNSRDVKRGTEISLRGMKSGTNNTLAEYVTYAITLIIQTKNIIISKMQNISNEFIKTKFIEAYKYLATQSQYSIQTTDTIDSVFGTLLLDPIYHYLLNINNVDKTDTYLVDKLDYVMGATLPELERQPDIFGKIRLPIEKDISKFFELIPMKYEDYTIKSGINNIVSIAVKSGYYSQSHKMFFDKVVKRSYLDPVYTDYNLSKQLVEIFDKYREFRAIEISLAEHIMMTTAKLYHSYKHINDTQWRDQNMGLGHLFDENGLRHIWSIYVVNYDGTIIEHTIKDLDKLVTGGKYINKTLLDRKCTVCGELQSNVNKFSNDRIIAALDNINAISNFFKFYEYRCPKGGLHNFIDIACTKCSVTRSILQNHLSAEASKYYATYRNQYSTDRTSLLYIKEEVESIKEIKKDETELEKKYDAWTFNYNVVLDLSNKLKINQFVLTTMGAVEGQEYSNILSGTYIPPEIEEKNASRIFVCDAYIRQLIIEYNQLRYYYTMTKPPIELKELMDKSEIQQYSYNKLPELMPSIAADYIDALAWFKKNKKPKLIISFLIHEFAAKCLLIYNHIEKTTKLLRELFIEYIVKKVTKGEESISKPGQFNWSVFKLEDHELEEQYNENYDSDKGVADEEFFEDEKLENTADAIESIAEVYDMENEETAEDNENDIGEDVE